MTTKESSLKSILTKCNQLHLLSDVPEDKVDAFTAQILKLNKQYPGGLQSYVAKARKLLKDKLEDRNPFEGFVPHVPPGEKIRSNDIKNFEKFENIGMNEISRTGFVLVAGGLGERLGFSGIKVALPIETVTNDCYLARYCQHILAFQAYARKKTEDSKLTLPLFIMTSGDTHESTIELLTRSDHFGMSPDQITVVQQDKVPALCDNDAKFAKTNSFTVSTKPHGHGDVHLVLHQSGTISKWKKRGIKWLVFFQDTNGLVFHSIPSALGVSAQKKFVMNSITVRRKPGEAVGAICRLKNDKDPSKEITINVEYSEISALLKSTTSPDGDVADPETGFSPFPGNINALVVYLPTYSDALSKTSGIIPEFINPKYKDASKTTFKKPTRLECMMQDLPKLLDAKAKVGFTEFERWMCFSAVKNSIQGGAEKQRKTGFAESASTGEADIYRYYRRALNEINVRVQVDSGVTKEWTPGIKTPVDAAKIVIVPCGSAFNMTSMRNRFRHPRNVSITNRSTLILRGDVIVEKLDLDGALIVTAEPGVRVRIKNLIVKNQGIVPKQIQVGDTNQPESLRIRGYEMKQIFVEHHVYRKGDGDSKTGEVLIDQKK